MLRFLIAAREEVQSTQLRDDLLSMLVAGHETTGGLIGGREGGQVAEGLLGEQRDRRNATALWRGPILPGCRPPARIIAVSSLWVSESALMAGRAAASRECCLAVSVCVCFVAARGGGVASQCVWGVLDGVWEVREVVAVAAGQTSLLQQQQPQQQKQ